MKLKMCDVGEGNGNNSNGGGGGASHASSAYNNISAYGMWAEPNSFGSLGGSKYFPFVQGLAGGKLKMIISNLLIVCEHLSIH